MAILVAERSKVKVNAIDAMGNMVKEGRKEERGEGSMPAKKKTERRKRMKLNSIRSGFIATRETTVKS
jgi:hypothetical protein